MTFADRGYDAHSMCGAGGPSAALTSLPLLRPARPLLVASSQGAPGERSGGGGPVKPYLESKIVDTEYGYRYFVSRVKLTRR